MKGSIHKWISKINGIFQIYCNILFCIHFIICTIHMSEYKFYLSKWRHYIYLIKWRNNLKYINMTETRHLVQNTLTFSADQLHQFVTA